MSPPRRSSVAPIPEQLEPLVERLAGLNEQDRELVIRAARRRRRSRVVLKAVPWDVLWRASGTVSLGGNAVEDANALYDG
jgi:hypothetical protein